MSISIFFAILYLKLYIFVLCIGILKERQSFECYLLKDENESKAEPNPEVPSIEPLIETSEFHSESSSESSDKSDKSESESESGLSSVEARPINAPVPPDTPEDVDFETLETTPSSVGESAGPIVTVIPNMYDATMIEYVKSKATMGSMLENILRATTGFSHY